jgi:HEAT repeat protein
MRNKPDAAARKLFRQLVDDSNVKVAVAAIGGIAAAQQLDDAPTLRTLVDKAAADRRRAAAWALGELHDTGAIGVLSDVLAVKDDRLVGDAAWALGEIAVSAPTDAKVKPLVERFLYLGKHGAWGAAINGSGALARYLWALPREQRTLDATQAQGLGALAFHKSRLVRINAALALSSLAGDDAAIKTLLQLVDKDSSPHVRIAAAQGLARASAGASKDTAAKITAALEQAARNDPEQSVRDAAKDAQGGAPALAPRNEWRTFQVVDPSSDDAPVRQTAYFVHTTDGVVWATYTDARGEINTEHIPAATSRDDVRPENRESEY